MISSILNKRPIQITLNVVIILIALGCVFTPNYILFKIGSSFAVHIMLTYLFLGLAFLALRQPQLTFTSFLCCAGLCLFLKFYSNWDWPMIQKEDASKTTVHLAHFNIANSEEPYDETVASILKVNADVLSFQEVTPDWHAAFEKALRKEYPYATSMVSMTPYGLAIYSKTPILDIDTFYFNEIPNLAVTIADKEAKADYRLVSSYTEPPIYSLAYQNLIEHMVTISREVNKSKLPTFAIGDYNAPPWWDEIQLLMNESALLDSRSCATQGLDNLWKYPVDYIFHSNNFECIAFDKVEKTLYGHLGIQAAFQKNTKTKNEHQAALK
ncbi:MAG: endonuclease/exonuclease/phosphatase (EEP) superfamily protein YafD [Patescibacteria group bacterium]|jgi:endonuclease/exonuclease/phosphatase (EEP) superfamily protein YafD